jgi:hypothetical protein
LFGGGRAGLALDTLSHPDLAPGKVLDGLLALAGFGV